MKSKLPIDWISFLWWLGSGLVLGFTAGLAINYFIPITYTSRAVLASAEPPGLEARLSPARARQIASEFEDGARSPSPEAIRDSVRLRTTVEGLEITATSPTRHLARDIAAFTARNIGTIREEQQLAGGKLTLPAPASAADSQNIRDWYILRNLLKDQARNAFFIDFREVPVLAGSGSLKAKKLLLNEDFDRRFTRYSELTTLLGDKVPSTSPLPKVLVHPETSQKPDSAAYAELLSDLSSYLGTLLGALGGFIFARKPVSHLPEAPLAPASW